MTSDAGPDRDSDVSASWTAEIIDLAPGPIRCRGGPAEQLIGAAPTEAADHGPHAFSIAGAWNARRNRPASDAAAASRSIRAPRAFWRSPTRRPRRIGDGPRRR